MNAAQVIGLWWDNFSRSSVGQFCLLVCFALGLGERNGERRERRLEVAAQRRTRGVGRAGVPGARNAGTVGDGGAQPLERSATDGVPAGDRAKQNERSEWREAARVIVSAGKRTD